MPVAYFHRSPTGSVANRRSPNRSRFCCPGDDAGRSFSLFPVSTTMCCLLQTFALAGLVAAAVTGYWRVRQWSIGEFTYRRFWGLWQTCTSMYAEHGLRLRSQLCYSRMHAGSAQLESRTVDGRLLPKEDELLDEWEKSCLVLMIFACVHALIGVLLHAVCCLRSPFCLTVWAGLGICTSGGACIVYVTHFLALREERKMFQSPSLAARVPETLELGWSYYLALASTACQGLLVAALIAFCVYASKRSARAMLAAEISRSRSGESFV